MVDNRLLRKKEPKKVSTFNLADDLKKQDQQKTVNILKSNSPIVPCLGPGLVQRTGKKVTECTYLTFEDLNKLITFKRGQVSSFIEDLISHLTIGLVSAKNIEQHLSHLREEHQGEGFGGIMKMTKCRNLQEYLVEKKLEQLSSPGTNEKSIPLRTLKN